MPRLGAEAKPPWQAVPLAVRREVEAALGAPVIRAARIWGGYGPSATFRLTLAGERRAFLKGVDGTSNSHMRRTLAQEEQVYRDLGDLIAPWAPAFYGALRRDGWHVLLLEDLGPPSVPPWSVSKTRRAAAAYAEFHRATLHRPLPRWLPRRRVWGKLDHSWDQVATTPADLEGITGMAGDQAADAQAWITAALPQLRRAAAGLRRVRPPYTLLHFDTRSDNIRLATDRHAGQTPFPTPPPPALRLFDWPFACAGPAEVDAAAFAQSIACEGGPAPERFMAWYAAGFPVREGVLDACVAAIAGYFANSAWRPSLPGLPRLRTVQRRQLRASLPWAARRLGLPPPSWLDAVPDGPPAPLESSRDSSGGSPTG